MEELSLKPISSFMEHAWGGGYPMPMEKWLLQDMEEEPDYQQRMRLLGNVVVPPCAALAGDLLLRMHRWNSAC